MPGVCQTGETFAIGRLGTLTDASGDTQYCYDRRGNTVRKVQTVTGAATTRTVAYGYDLADRVASMTYPSGATVSYTRDATGRVTGVNAQPTSGATSVTIVSDIDYLPFGPANVITFGNGRTLTKAYDQNYGIDAVTDSATGGLSIDLGLDDVGNVTAIDERLTTGATAARTVEYDDLDRLTALKNGGTATHFYEYDATGNRTKNGASNVYTYANDSHRLTMTGSTARSYDAAGNGTGYGTRGFAYDDAGRMTEYLINGVLNAEYAHNGLGQRVSKTWPGTPSNNTYFVYDEAGHLIGEYLSNGARFREYVWIDDTLVAILNTHAGSSHQYVLTDHLNTPRAVVMPTNNAIIWRWDLTGSAFGEHAVDQNPDGDANQYILPLRYPGQYHDMETALYYNYFRDYDPTTGRYLQSDPVGLAGGIQTYGYSGQDPLGSVDPFGLTASNQGIPLLVPIPLASMNPYVHTCEKISLIKYGLGFVPVVGLAAPFIGDPTTWDLVQPAANTAGWLIERKILRPADARDAAELQELSRQGREHGGRATNISIDTLDRQGLRQVGRHALKGLGWVGNIVGTAEFLDDLERCACKAREG